MRTLPFIILLILSSCSASNQLKRANKLISKAEAKGATWSIDTVFQTIEIVRESIKLDTVVDYTTDTIVVTKDKLITKVLINEKEKKVYIESKLPADTVVKVVTHTVTKTITAGKNNILWIVLAVIAGVVVVRVVLR